MLFDDDILFKQDYSLIYVKLDLTVTYLTCGNTLQKKNNV